MPRGDGTGPMGTGSMTGRGVGYCAGNTAPGFASAGLGGRCRGFAGGGYGRRNMFYATGQPGWARFGGVNAPLADPEVEQAALKGRAEALGTELEQIKARLEALESKKPQD